MKNTDLTNAIVIIDTTTNNAKHDRQNKTSSTHTNKLLQEIIHTYIQTYNTPHNLIIMETIPSLTHDIHPYNNAAFSICRQSGVRFSPTLVGESHLWDDGIHVVNRFRPLLVSSVAAAVLNVDPRAHFRLPSPPHGPNGPWRHPWGSRNRPSPSSCWPPPRLSTNRNSYCDVAAAPSLSLRRSMNIR